MLTWLYSSFSIKLISKHLLEKRKAELLTRILLDLFNVINRQLVKFMVHLDAEVTSHRFTLVFAVDRVILHNNRFTCKAISSFFNFLLSFLNRLELFGHSREHKHLVQKFREIYSKFTNNWREKLLGILHFQMLFNCISKCKVFEFLDLAWWVALFFPLREFLSYSWEAYPSTLVRTRKL